MMPVVTAAAEALKYAFYKAFQEIEIMK